MPVRIVLAAALALALLGGPPVHAAPAARGALAELGEVETRPMQELKAEYDRRLADELGPKAGTFAALGPGVVFQQLIQEHLANKVPSRRVKYTSKEDQGRDRIYSGRVFLPSRKPGTAPQEAPLVIYQHGTETRRSFVPYYRKGDETLFGAMAADLCGLVVAMPDGDGMGADPSPRKHAYCQAATTSACVLDMIRAVLNGEADGQRVFDDSNFIWDGEIYLVGYSEGGYITMAAVKELSTNPAYADIKVTGAAAISAGRPGRSSPSAPPSRPMWTPRVSTGPATGSPSSPCPGRGLKVCP